MRGIQTVSVIKNQNKKISNVIFDKPKIEDHKVLISNITIVLDKPGKYVLIFGANGVFTDVNTEETLIDVQDNIHIVQQIFNWGETIILTVFYFIVLLFSSKLIKGYWMFIAILATAGYVYLVTWKSDSSMFYMGTVYAFAGVIAIFLIWAFITFLIDACIRRKEPNFYYKKKKDFYLEHVYQKLNGHPSNHWINKKKKRNLRGLGYYNTETKDMSDFKSSLHKGSHIKGSVVDEESKRPIDQDMTASFDEYRAQSVHSLLSDYTPAPRPRIESQILSKQDLKEYPVDMVPYEDLGFFKKFLRIFTPFELMYKKVWITD